uniref:Carboxypeptidase n=1 Tax=Oryza meridionalis TaxID=40149 RepID=A0A0E0D646_9ORYZ
MVWIKYVGVDEETGSELFYYFVESERSPSTDPVILWLTGGPGCSGFSGVVFEVDGKHLFLDTPVGSGFSYAHDPKGYNVGDISSSSQVVTFLKKWFNDHPRYLSNHFYVGGSSYAGKVIPIIMKYISEGIEQRQQPLGYIVGNPITGSKIDDNFKIPYSHGVGIISDQLYEAAVANCNGDYVTTTNELCAKALNAIDNLMSEVDDGNILDDKCVRATPKPINDVSRSRSLLEDYIRLSEPTSYRYYLSFLWMNKNMTREALKIKKGTVGEWIRCKTGLPYVQDVASSIKYHFDLTTGGYRALVFRFTILYANNLTFATVKGGGHTSIETNPKQGFAMGKPTRALAEQQRKPAATLLLDLLTMGSHHHRSAGQCSLVQPPRLITCLLLLLLLFLSPPALPCSASSSSYIGIEEKSGTELFYYFVESERNPDTDPLVLWLEGGPRCSAFSGLAYEWLNDHPRYRSHNFYVGGASYAGKGYIVGNPITGSKFDKNFHVPYSHGVGIISDQLYEAAVTHCKGDFVNPTNQLCANVVYTINKLMSEVSDGNILEDKCVKAAPKPTIDVSASRALLEEEYSRLSKPPIRPSMDCASYGYYLSYCWMNDNTTRDALKIKKGTIGEWLRCSRGVLPYAHDIPSALDFHFNLTTRGYRALVMRFTITYANNLTFATVKGGSHVAPVNRPKESFAMGKRKQMFLELLTMGAHPTRQCSLLQLRLATCVLFLLLPLLLPCSASSSVITHLPGFHGRLPFHLETGNVSVDEETGTELFYYYIESERSPSTDPVILWLTGGPLCSGFTALVFEVGPMNFVLAPYNGSLPQLVNNPYSWTKIASIIFLDTPVGSGFSYARDPKGYNVGDISSSLQVVTFLKKWFNDHPSYLSNHFYVGGSSYAGKVIPLIAQYISEGLYGWQPLDRPKAAVANCKGDYFNPTNEICANVLNAIDNLMSELDNGDILLDKCAGCLIPKPINGVSSRALLEEYSLLSEPTARPTINCFSYRFYLLNIWMNDKATRDALKIKKGTVGVWTRCNTEVFPYARDVPSTIHGDHDLMVPFLGTQAWIRSLNFTIVDDWRAWHLDGQAAGFTVMYDNNLTFATLKGSGHAPISYKPKQGFAMGRRWLDRKPL